jgi:hypothetical protein
MYHLLHEKMFIQYQSENSIINNIVGYTEQTKEIDLKSLLSDSIKLVFRFHERNCNACVEQALKSLMEFNAKIGVNNILIITSYQDIRKMKIFVQQYAPGIQIFNVNEDINIPLDKWDTPYFFVTDNTLKAQLVFIPIKEIQNYTWEYLNIIYQRYFQ